MTRASLLAALAAADLAEEQGELARAAELLAQVEREARPPEGRTVDGRRLAAAEAYTSELYLPRTRVRA